jgi:1,4-dihydroxy-6-naphthoate synthase
LKINIGISPCPNDTFIFEGIYTHKIDTGSFEFEFIFEDVQTLNQMAVEGQYDIIKLSYAQYFHVMDEYVMLRSGGALGMGVGPLLIAKQEFPESSIRQKQIAIPGVGTTANFLLNFAYPQLHNLHEYAFSDIEQAIEKGEVDAGVIIHENRFTYKEKGFVLIKDLGSYWEQKTSFPLPLGGIAVRRSFSSAMKQELNQLIRKSILFAKSQPEKLSPFIRYHAQEMNEDVMLQHINLYVNEFSLDVSTAGVLGVMQMQHIMDLPSPHAQFIELDK